MSQHQRGELITAVRTMREKMNERLPRTQELSLTPQEKKVLKLVVKAQTNKEIAATMGISPSTVKRHLESVLRKLNLENRVAAAVYAVRKGDRSLGGR